MRVPLSDTQIIAPNFKKRLSGVTSTIIQLVPRQCAMGVKIATLSPKGGLPETLPALSWVSLLGLWRKPATRPFPMENGLQPDRASQSTLTEACGRECKNRPFRLWHARRNIEMVVGLLLRDMLRMKLRLVFTSAAQRHHRRFTRFLIRRMDRVIATSARSGAFLQVPHRVIMHGVDVVRFHPPQGAADDFAATGLGGVHAIGCFGRLRHQKGTDLFVEAMITLLPHYPQWTALISGRTTPEHAAFVEGLKARIAAANLSRRIIFLGEVEDISQWYRRLTLYVAPSRNEGFGLTPLEAMASQTAVVASDAGAYAELIPNDCGTIVPAGDGQALTNAIRPYLAEPQKTIEAGSRALAHVRAHFPLEREATQIAQLYEELFSEQK